MKNFDTNLFKQEINKLLNKRIPLLAAALSFSSLFSLIPFFAILFAILKAFDVDKRVEPLILSQISYGSSKIVIQVMQYIHNTKVSSMSIVGLLLLILSIASTLDTLEDAFNSICEVKNQKALHIKVRDYLIIIAMVPLFIATASFLATTLYSNSITLWFLKHIGIKYLFLLKSIPFLSTLFGLTILYRFLPNFKSRLYSALLSATMTTILLRMAQNIYLYFQFYASKQNAIYGALSILPAFMIWLYICWIIVLIGMELLYRMELFCSMKVSPDRSILP